MLRILVFEEPFSVKFRLQGELTAQTASQLSDRWTQVRNTLRERKMILDLGDVVEIDEAGRNVLASLADAGVRFGYAHPNLQVFIEDLASRHGKNGTDRRNFSICRVGQMLRSILPSRLHS